MERRLKFWALRLGGTTQRPHFVAGEKWVPPAYGPVTVTVTVFEVTMLVPLMYCATIVDGPGVVKDVTHIGVTPF